MKKKLLIVFLLSMVLACIFAVSAFAQGYTVNYYGKAQETTNEDGTITLKSDPVYKLGTNTYTLKDKDGNDQTVGLTFFGWYTNDGRVFEPGETITLTEDTYLYQATGIEIYDANDFLNNVGRESDARPVFVRVCGDFTLTAQVSTERTGNGAMAVIDLNGHNITSSANYAFGGARSGLKLLGKGTVTHTGKGGLFYTAQHGSYDGEQHLFVGKDVNVTTPGSLFFLNNDLVNANPTINIYGTVSAKYVCDVQVVKDCKINFADGADITLSGTKLVNIRKADLSLEYTVNMYNAKLTVPEDFVWFDEIAFFAFNVVDGSTNVLPVAGVLNSGYKAIMNEETGYYDIEYVACPNSQNGEHNFVEAELYGDNIFCTDGRLHYFRCECGEYYIKSVSYTGHAFGNEVIIKNPTTTENGIKQVDCERCDYFYTYEFSGINIVVKDGEGTKSFFISADELYDMTIDENIDGSFLARIDTIKSFTVDGVTYTKNDIVVLTIPTAINQIATGVIKDMASLKEIILSDDTNVTFTKGTIDNCPELEKITAGECNLIFSQGTSNTIGLSPFTNCPKLITLDFTNANVTFDKYSFASDKTIKHLIMGTGKTYKFGVDAFRHSVLEEVIFPDNSSISLSQKSFAETVTIKYVYVGYNTISSKKLGDDNTLSSVFGGNSYLEKVVLMDITYIGKWVFSTKKPGNAYEPLCDLHIYSHSATLKANAEAFNDRAGNYCIYLYTLDSTLTSITSTSKYVIYNGLGHAYTQNVISESTCVTPGKVGYVTDCGCGLEYRENTFTTYSNKFSELNNKTHEAYGTEISELPLKTEHTHSDTIKSIDFVNGYLQKGTISYKCLYCDEVATIEAEPSFAPLFTSRGYSYSTTSSGMMVGFIVEKKAIREYTEVMGSEIEYGVFAVAYSRIGQNEAIDSQGKEVEGVARANISARADYDIFEMRIVGFSTDEQKDAPLVFGGYAIEKKSDNTLVVNYLQVDEPQEGERYSYTTYNTVISRN